MSCHQEMPQNSTKWYFSKEELETRSPSRKEGVSIKKENSLRLHYCLFLQDLGMKLGLPQVAIASAIMFCHRFYLYQSHAKNDWQSIATICLFLASKVEETPCALSKFIPASYEMIHKKDPGAAKRIQSKEIYEKHKELILKGERLILATLGFDLEIQHPYKPLVAAIKKLGLKQNDLVKVAWNFVNDWLKTTLCLQYKSHYIAAGSLYLAAKVTKFKLPSEKGNVWWHEFDISPQLFEGVIRQMMLLVGYKGGSVVSSASNDKDKQTAEVENEDQCSPESCVLSRPGSVEEEANPNLSVKLLDQESEPIRPINGNVKTFKEEGACVSRVTKAGDMISEIDKERIKAALKRRRERETAKIVVAGDSSEEAWIEMELESGIEHVRTPVKKKPSL